jgi:hypothetical protein
MPGTLNKLQELMVLTMEECGELTQRCSKIIRKFETLEEVTEEQRVLLLEEVGDVQCLIDLMIDCGLLTKAEIDARIYTKRDKLKIWSKLIK